MTAWDYKVISRSGTNLIAHENEIIKLGAEGWELVAVVVSQAFHVLYFKRPASVLPLAHIGH